MGNKAFTPTDQLEINAVHKDMLHWFWEDKIITITQTGMYSISPLNVLPDNVLFPQALRFVHPDTKEVYYFSYTVMQSNYSHKALVHSHHNSTAPSVLIKILENGEYYVVSFQKG